MNAKTIELDAVITSEDYRRVLLPLYLKRFLIIGVLYSLIAIPMLWLTLFGAGADPFDGKDNSAIAVMVLFALIPILMAGGLLLTVWKYSRNLEKELGPAKFIFSEDGVESISKSVLVKRTWDGFRVEELKNDFLFYPERNSFYTIPKHVFRDDFQIEQLRILLRERLGDKAKLKNYL